MATLAAIFGVAGAACGETDAIQTPGEPAAPGLPPNGALTMGGEAGQVLVGLTLTPGDPGRNLVTIYLEPLQGPQAAASLQATLSVGTTTRALHNCGATCRQATLQTKGGEDFDVDVLGPTGGVATFELPNLPAPSGEALLSEVQTRMHRLQTYRDYDTLFGGTGPTTVTEAVDEAPDRAEWTVDGAETIWIGTTQYSRQGPGQPWTATPGMLKAVYPFFVWDPFTPLLDAHIVGSAIIGDIRTIEVAFFGSNPAIPVWFEVWVAPGGLILKEQMVAAGHFMHDIYSGFNEPASITPPSTYTVATPASGAAPSGSAQRGILSP